FSKLLLLRYVYYSYFFYLYLAHPILHSFPTRRSSDLSIESGQVAADMRAVLRQPPDAAAVERLSSVVETNILLRSTCTTTMIDGDRKSTRLNSSHQIISYAVFCLKKKIQNISYIHYMH